MVDWLAGKRIKGTSTERTTTAGIGTGVGGWVELGRTTLGSAGDTISVASLANKRYYMVLMDTKHSVTASTENLRFNNDIGTNYSRRKSYNGLAEEIVINDTTTNMGGWENTPTFSVNYISNYATKEKLNIFHVVYQGTAGAGETPHRIEGTAKWTNISDAINRIDAINTAGGDLLSGSELVVLGWNPADTHSTNFWTELASVDWSSGGTIDSGTFTAKKYLWVQGWWKGNDSVYIRANNDIDPNYSWRYSSNGVKPDGVQTSRTGFTHNFGFTTTIHFINMFIINNSANEKLVILHANNQGTAGAGFAPNRSEAVCKWANTSSQITSLKFMTGSGNFTGGTIKVWGSD